MHLSSPGQNRKALMAIVMGAFLLLVAPDRSPPIPPEIHTLSGATMGTSWQVQVVTGNGTQGPDARLGQTIVDTLSRLDKQIFSTYDSGSELSRLNTTAVGDPLFVSRELQEVLLLARTIHQQSFGTFDVSVGALVNLWGFGAVATQGVPDQAAIDAAKMRLGGNQYQVNIREGTAQRNADIALDLSAIAKGYAVDRIAELLQQQDFTNFLVEIGGEIRVQGTPEAERDWTIAIETPQQGEQLPFTEIRNFGQGFALAGSGDYRNYFEQDGRRYSHEIDPRTGYPIDHALAAVTVLADTAAEADAWATAMMVLGPVDGPYLAAERHLAVFFIIRGIDGWESRYTPEFEPYLKNLGSN